MAETSCRIREINEKGKLDRSQSKEKQLFENLHRTQSEQSDFISKLCSQLVLNRLPSAEPDIFSGDPLLYNDWINSFEALISSRSLPDSEGIQPPSEKDRLIKFKLLDFSRYLSEFYQNFTKNNFLQDLPAKMFVFVFYVYVTT